MAIFLIFALLFILACFAITYFKLAETALILAEKNGWHEFFNIDSILAWCVVILGLIVATVIAISILRFVMNIILIPIRLPAKAGHASFVFLLYIVSIAGIIAAAWFSTMMLGEYVGDLVPYFALSNKLNAITTFIVALTVWTPVFYFGSGEMQEKRIRIGENRYLTIG